MTKKIILFNKIWNMYYSKKVLVPIALLGFIYGIKKEKFYLMNIHPGIFYSLYFLMFYTFTPFFIVSGMLVLPPLVIKDVIKERYNKLENKKN